MVPVASTPTILSQAKLRIPGRSLVTPGHHGEDGTGDSEVNDRVQTLETGITHPGEREEEEEEEDGERSSLQLEYLVVPVDMHLPIPGVVHAVAHRNHYHYHYHHHQVYVIAVAAGLPAQLHLHIYMIVVLWHKARIEDEPAYISKKLELRLGGAEGNEPRRISHGVVCRSGYISQYHVNPGYNKNNKQQ